jgi:hypothetical protein
MVECKTIVCIKYALIYGNVMGLFLCNICQRFESHLMQNVFIKAFLKWKASYERQMEHKNNTEKTMKTHTKHREKAKFCYILGYYIMKLLCVLKFGTMAVLCENLTTNLAVPCFH